MRLLTSFGSLVSLASSTLWNAPRRPGAAVPPGGERLVGLGHDGPRAQPPPKPPPAGMVGRVVEVEVLLLVPAGQRNKIEAHH